MKNKENDGSDGYIQNIYKNLNLIGGTLTDMKDRLADLEEENEKFDGYDG